MSSRAWVDLVVDLLIDDLWHPCHLVDVSATGMMFATGRGLALRQPHFFAHYTLRLPSSTIVDVIGRPIWHHGALQAARFVALDDLALQSLSEVVRASDPASSSDLARLERAEAKDARRTSGPRLASLR